jgi:type VI secretion system protein ImpK
MVSENPFAEPGDPDRTIIRPQPGGSRAPPRPTPATPRLAEHQAAPTSPDLEAISVGDGPLAIAAAPLLHLLARLRNVATAPDPGDMRERTRRELRTFERRARELGVAPDHLRLAHYALCAALDDVALNTPWGSQGRWRDEPLARTLHDDQTAGDGFFRQLRTLRDALPASRPVLEIMFLCLSLGMMGPFRATPEGPAQLERVRHHVFEIIAATAPPVPAALAREARGVSIPSPPSGGIPIWVAGSAALAVIAAAYVYSLTSLNVASDDLFHAALAAAPAAMASLIRPPATPPPPPPPEPLPGPDARLRTALSDLRDIEVVATPASTILRIPARALFPQLNATLASGPLLDRIAGALTELPGPVRVLAYTDSQPFRTVAFPSNFALSVARAKAVRAALARTLPDIARIIADGRGDADPVAPNATPEGRARNRRIDIVLPGTQ